MSGRLFAVIPAAGHSRRMGRPKLLLELAGRTVIRRLLDALATAGVGDCVVVSRKGDHGLQEQVAAAGASIVTPAVDPPDMRSSVEHALEFLHAQYNPSPEDGWLLSPADHPVLDVDVISRLIGHWQSSASGILVPVFEGRRGHPTMFRWRLAEAVAGIPPDRGLNQLLEQFSSEIEEFPVDDASVLTDLDTPDDFERLRRELE